MTENSIFDYSKVQNLDKQKQAQNEQLDILLDQNDLIRKKLPDGPSSLLKAVSDALYSNSHYAEEIQQFLFKHLKHLIATDKLPARLTMFRGNTMLLKDYTNSPQMAGFDKINLDLISLQFKTKIVVYHASEDNYLSAMIVNNHYEKTIRLVRSKNNHYEPAYSKLFTEKMGVAQNIILNLIERALNKDNTAPFKDINKDSYINFEYLNWLSSDKTSTFLIEEGQAQKTPIREMSGLSSTAFIGSPPPGLTPGKYPQKAFEFTELGIRSNSGLASSPGIQRPNSQASIDSLGQVTPTRDYPQSTFMPSFGGSSPTKSLLYENRKGRADMPLIRVQNNEGITQQGPGSAIDTGASSAKKKPIILDDSKERYTGRLKFFDEVKNFGFVIMDADNSDIFVHMDDLMKANISKDMLKEAKNGVVLRLSFSCTSYIGRHDKSRKATDIQLIQ